VLRLARLYPNLKDTSRPATPSPAPNYASKTCSNDGLNEKHLDHKNSQLKCVPVVVVCFFLQLSDWVAAELQPSHLCVAPSTQLLLEHGELHASQCLPGGSCPARPCRFTNTQKQCKAELGTEQKG